MNNPPVYFRDYKPTVAVAEQLRNREPVPPPISLYSPRTCPPESVIVQVQDKRRSIYVNMRDKAILEVLGDVPMQAREITAALHLYPGASNVAEVTRRLKHLEETGQIVLDPVKLPAVSGSFYQANAWRAK